MIGRTSGGLGAMERIHPIYLGFVAEGQPEMVGRFVMPSFVSAELTRYADLLGFNALELGQRRPPNRL